uniref:HU family DNA-binding protein n=1 Tax=Bacteroides fragilis TaxID=817 RepID=UPI003561E3DC
MGGLYYNLALRNSDVGNKDSEKLYYCVLKNRGMVDQETFVNYLSQISGVQDALCLAVLSKLGAAITNFLKDGQSVEIPHLGSFNLTVNSSGVKTLDEAKASQIKSINLRFSSKEETDLALSRCTLTRSVLMTNTNDVIKEKDPSGEIVDDPTA